MIIMNAIFQMLNPSNTLTVNRLLAHAIGLSEAVVYAALISKCSYYERNGMLDDSGWFYSTVPDLEASTGVIWDSLVRDFLLRSFFGARGRCFVFSLVLTLLLIGQSRSRLYGHLLLFAL